jgi:hypothetical protein
LEILEVLTKRGIFGFVALITGLVVIISVGCSDNDENKAVKELRNRTSEALAMADRGEFEKARKMIKAALGRGAGAGGAAVDAALLARGSFALWQSNGLGEKLGGHVSAVKLILDEISQRAGKINSLTIEKERLEGLIKNNDEQVAQLGKLIDGQEAGEGIKAELSAAQGELAVLEQGKKQFEQKILAAAESAAKLERWAKEMFGLAESADGDEKLRLLQKGYEFQRAQKPFHAAKQEAANEAALRESKISVVSRLAEKLAGDMESAQRQIEEIKNSRARSGLRSQVNDILPKISEHDKSIAWLSGDLKGQRVDYNKTVGEVIVLIEEAAGDYKKVKSRDSRLAAEAYLADCYRQIGSVASAGIVFEQNVSGRLGAVAESMEDTTQQNLGNLSSAFAVVNSEYVKTAKENFDLAIEKYESIRKQAGRKDDAFTLDILTNYVVTLYDKMMLADRLGDYDAVDALLDKADEIIAEAREYDTGFAKTPAARLISGTTDYIPQLPVDNTAYYMQLKKQFQGWQKVELAEREAEVRRLLDELAKLKESLASKDFNEIIGPEEKQMRTALERGFDETTTTMTMTFDPTDPNYM